MKIIDTHTHLPGRFLGARPRPIAAIHEELEAGGLSAAWIFTTDGLYREEERNNDVLAEAVRDHRDFFTPFCTVSPHDGADTACREMDRCAREHAMRGLKLHPWLQSFSLTHPAVVPILRHAGRIGMPVVFHDGSPPYSAPLQIGWAAEQCPRTTIVLGHAGLDDLFEDAIAACLRQPNVLLCLCGPSSGHVAEIIRRVPAEKILFGSDGGFASGVVEWTIAKVTEVVASEKVRRLIFAENPIRIMERRGEADGLRDGGRLQTR